MKRFLPLTIVGLFSLIGHAQCIESIPYAEDFSSTAFSMPQNNPAAGNIPGCWNRNNTSGLYWRPDQGNTSQNNSGPSGDHTSGNGKYIVVEADGTDFTTTQTTIETPWVDLSGTTAPELRFWLHQFGFAIGAMGVQVQTFGSTSWSALGTATATQSASSDAWEEEVFPLTAYVNDTIKIRFVGNRSNAFSSFCQTAVDDILVWESNSCARPNSFNVQSRTQTSITLAWVSTNGTAPAEIRYVEVGQPISSATIVNAGTNNPFTVTGLNPSISYQFWVRDSCAGGYSLWEGPLSATTVCGTVNAPWSESFEGGGFTPPAQFNQPGSIQQCWNRNPSSSGYLWITGPPPFTSNFTGPSAAHDGTQWAQTSRVGFSTNNGPLLRSPRINLSTLTNPELRFWVYMFGTNIDRLEVDVKTPTGNWTNMITITGQQQFTNTATWEEQVVSLSSFANQDIFIRFTGFHNGSNFNADIAIDLVSVEEAPPCPRPNPFNVVGVSSNSVTLNWTSGGTAPWQVEYGAPGFAPGTGTLVNVNSNPVNISGLTPQTSYEFYIRDTCGALGVSTWTGPVSATTSCLPVTAPWVEDFDGSNFSNSGQFNVQGTIDGCWSAPGGSSNLFWTPSPVAFQLATSGPVIDHTSGSGDYMYVTGGGFNAPDTAVLRTPLIDISALTNPEVTFWYHLFGTNIKDLKVYIWDGTSNTLERTITGQQQTSGSAPWKEGIINLANYVGDTIQLTFVMERSTIGSAVRAALDDIDVHEQPPCPKPTSISVVNPTTTSLDVVWDTVGGTSWIIEYGPPGFSLGSGTQVTATGSPFIINGLLSGTTYEFYVYNDCGANGLSAVSTSALGTTACAPKNAPFSETFDGADWVIPATFGSQGEIGPCWVRQDTTSYVWKPSDRQEAPLNTGPDRDHTTGSGKYMYTDFVSFGNNSTVFRTPEINLSPLDTPQLRFWYYMYGQSISKLEVQVKQGSAPWTTVSTINGQQQIGASLPWQERVVNLNNYINQTVFIRFVAEKTATGFQADIAIDDVTIDEKPSCPGPTNLTAVGVSEDAIELSWTSGGGTSWVIEYGPPGFVLGTGNTITAQNNPFIVNGLATGAAYEFYVRDSCSNGGVSWFAGPTRASTFPCANACLYELKLEDQFSNGWTVGFGGGLTHFVDVIVNGTTTSYTLESGGSQTFMVPVCDGLDVELFFRSSGFQSIECGIEFRDPSGTLLYDRNFGVSTLNTGSLYTTTGSCSPTCNNPVGLTIQNVGSTDADAFWSSLSGYSNIAWGAPGFTPTTPNQTAITGGSAALTGLAPNTTYDVYVQDSCDNGLLSSWVGPITFTTVSCAPPTAGFTASSTNLQASFDGSSSSANVTTHTWLFGDGNTGGGVNETHTYATPGIYTITLIVSNACGVTDTATQQIVVCGTPTAVFNSSTFGLSVTPNASGSGGIGNAYAWDFGDGNTGNGVNPTHTYGTQGTYGITLVVTDTCGSTDTIVDSVTVCSAPVASYTYSIAGFTATFNASASSNAVQYFWDFGDGNSGTGVNPTHTYTVNSNYSVLLYAVNACGDTAIDTQVVALCSDPFASWTYQIISSGGSGMLVQFDGTASVGSNYFWDFGDGNTATGTNFPTHTYQTPGLFYRVTLVVSNDCGDDDTLSYRLISIGLEEEDVQYTSVYPNPSSGIFFFDHSSSPTDPVSLQILSADGRLVKEVTSFESAEGKVGIELDQPAGTYLLRVEFSEGRIETHRIIIGQ